jgi:uncharacterized membrane protein SpoIIM required for sporulation
MSGAQRGALREWLSQRRSRWQRVARLLERPGERAGSPAEAIELTENYLSLARDVSLARRRFGAAGVAGELELLLARADALMTRAPVHIVQDLEHLLTAEIGDITRSLSGKIAAVTLLFVASAAGGWWLVDAYPETIGLFASEDMIVTVQRGELWTDDLLNVVPSSMLSLEIIANNVAVTLFAFTLGTLYGLGTLYIIGLNGLMLGATFAFTHQHALAFRLLEFVIAHGVVELSIVCLAGAAGLHLGEALARPGERSRSIAFREAVDRAGKLLLVCIPFLAGAGVIEGYVSPDDRFFLANRIAIGVGAWILLAWTLCGGAAARLRPHTVPRRRS